MTTAPHTTGSAAENNKNSLPMPTPTDPAIKAVMLREAKDPLATAAAFLNFAGQTAAADKVEEVGKETYGEARWEEVLGKCVVEVGKMADEESKMSMG